MDKKRSECYGGDRTRLFYPGRLKTFISGTASLLVLGRDTTVNFGEKTVLRLPV